MSDTPLTKKIRAEQMARLCREQAAKLRHPQSQIRLQARLFDAGRDALAGWDDMPTVAQPALRAFLVQHLEAEALRYDRVANGLRFEVIKWAEDQRAAMESEIAAFNAKRLT